MKKQMVVGVSGKLRSFHFWRGCVFSNDLGLACMPFRSTECETSFFRFHERKRCDCADLRTHDNHPFQENSLMEDVSSTNPKRKTTDTTNTSTHCLLHLLSTRQSLEHVVLDNVAALHQVVIRTAVHAHDAVVRVVHDRIQVPILDAVVGPEHNRGGEQSGNDVITHPVVVPSLPITSTTNRKRYPRRT